MMPEPMGKHIGEREASEPISDRTLSRSFARPLLGTRLARFVREEQLLIAVLAIFFFVRLWLSDWNSYWYDELLSIDIYGRSHDSAISAIRHLAEASIHPPLFQVVLYHWISAFGETEIATRALSNSYITGAALFLFLSLRHVYGRRIALASIVTFSVMYTPFYFAMEVRSYAQTILLVTLSSFLLLRMMRLGAQGGWRTTLLFATSGCLVLTNAGLLLTHYYNAFFVLAQAFIAIVFVSRELPVRRWLTGMGIVCGIYLAQVGIFAALWGSVFVADFARRAADYELDGAAESPLELLRTAVFQPNLQSPRWIKVVGLVVLVSLLVQGVVAIARNRGLSIATQKAWTTWYLVGWLTLPLVAVWTVFSLAGVARYSSRYFVMCTVPLAPLVVLTAEHAFRIARRLARRTGRHLSERLGVVAICTVVATVVLPGGHEAATQRKQDWRGITNRVVDVVRQGDNSSYIIYEAANRPEPMANHYFERLTRDIRATSTIARFEERSGHYRVFEEDQEQIAEHDFMILVFPHLRTQHFPVALEMLEERYEITHRQLNHMGRGFVVYDVGEPQR